MPVVDTESCDWRHALHRLIGILNWKTAGGLWEEGRDGGGRYHHPENCHAETMNKNVNSTPKRRCDTITTGVLLQASGPMTPTKMTQENVQNPSAFHRFVSLLCSSG